MNDRKKYDYRYVQFTVTPSEKELIERYVVKENFKTLSDFMRRLIFDHIRHQEHPELFVPADDSNINPILLERIARDLRDIQEQVAQRDDVLEEMRSMVLNVNKIVEANSLAREREQVVGLLEKHTSLSLRQIQEETNLPENVVFKVISDMNLFKITTSGRFALR